MLRDKAYNSNHTLVLAQHAHSYATHKGQASDIRRGSIAFDKTATTHDAPNPRDREQEPAWNSIPYLRTVPPYVWAVFRVWGGRSRDPIRQLALPDGDWENPLCD